MSCATNIDFEMKKLAEKLKFLCKKIVYCLEKSMKDHALLAIDEEEQILAEIKRKLKP